MINCGDYPAGAARDSRAPYNKKDNELIEVDVLCSQSLSKTVTIKTDSYTPRFDAESEQVDPDFSDTNWEEEMHANDYHTPLQLINLFKLHLKAELIGEPIVKSKRYIEHLIRECDAWNDDETTIIKD